MRLIISEEDKKKIRGLYEQTSEEPQKKIIEITDGSEIPQSLVDNPPIPATYWAHRGTYDQRGSYLDLCQSDNVCYRLRNADFNIHGIGKKGRIEAEKNSVLLTPQKDNTGQFLEVKFGNPPTIPAKDIVANGDYKWIGFVSDDRSTKFYCFKSKNDKFLCKEIAWVRQSL